MILAFYKVNNSLGLHRHSFDTIEDPEEILETLRELNSDEWHIYEISKKGYTGNYMPTASDFEDDYNDEILDGGYWVVAIDDKAVRRT